MFATLLTLILPLSLTLSDVARPDGQAPSLVFPLDCTLDPDTKSDTPVCYVVQYPDLDPGPGIVDPACGARTYDGHSGVDIAVRDLPTIATGVDVLAAADGVIEGTRNDMADRFLSDTHTPDKLGGKDCGNGVRIDHGAGWSTQYCHLKKGSIRVSEGDRITAGTPIGEMGYSGATEFPHLHITLRRDRETVDPMTGRPLGSPCTDPAPGSLWADDTFAVTPFTLGPLGFHTGRINWEQILEGEGTDLTFSTDTPALVVYGLVYGPTPGDRMSLRLVDAEGNVLANRTETLDRVRAYQMYFSGKLRPATGWPTGPLTATITFIDSETGQRETRTLTGQIMPPE